MTDEGVATIREPEDLKVADCNGKEVEEVE